MSRFQKNNYIIMKKFNLAFISIVLAIFSIAFVSCDDEETTKDNSFKYDGKTYKIAKGYLENYGSTLSKSVTSYNLDLTFFTSGLTYNTATGNVSGTGSYLYFEMFSTTGTQLTPGTYTYDMYESLNSGTFDYAEAGLNITIGTESGTYVDIVAGTVKVKLTDTKYEITIDLTSTENKKLTGYYKGSLTYLVIEDSKGMNEKTLKR
jgi:hypothetical protein